MVRRTKAEALETRHRILEASENAFFMRGMARTTLLDIAKLAGVTRGAIYWHFSSKVELVQCVFDSFTEPLEEALQLAISCEYDVLEGLRRFLVKLFESFATDPRMRRMNEIIFHKCELTDEMCDLRLQRQRISIRCNGYLQELLDAAKASGRLHRDLDTNIAAISIHAFIDGHIGLWLLQPGSFSISDNAERLIDSLLEMLQTSEALRSPSRREKLQRIG